MDKMKNKKFDEIVIPENLSQRMREGIEEGEKIYMRNKRNRMIRRGLTAAAAFMICVGFCIPAGAGLQAAGDPKYFPAIPGGLFLSGGLGCRCG